MKEREGGSKREGGGGACPPSNASLPLGCHRPCTAHQAARWPARDRRRGRARGTSTVRPCGHPPDPPALPPLPAPSIRRIVLRGTMLSPPPPLRRHHQRHRKRQFHRVVMPVQGGGGVLNRPLFLSQTPSGIPAQANPNPKIKTEPQNIVSAWARRTLHQAVGVVWTPFPKPPPSSVSAVPGGGVRGGGALPAVPRGGGGRAGVGGGGGGRPCRGGGGGTSAAQNDPHVALIIVTIHLEGGGFGGKQLFSGQILCSGANIRSYTTQRARHGTPFLQPPPPPPVPSLPRWHLSGRPGLLYNTNRTWF